MAAEDSVGWLLTAELGIQRAEAEVAMGLKRAHAGLLSQGQGLAVVDFDRFDLWRLYVHGNLAEEAQGIRLVAPFLMLTGERQRAR